MPHEQLNQELRSLEAAATSPPAAGIKPLTRYAVTEECAVCVSAVAPAAALNICTESCCSLSQNPGALTRPTRASSYPEPLHPETDEAASCSTLKSAVKKQLVRAGITFDPQS